MGFRRRLKSIIKTLFCRKRAAPLPPKEGVSNQVLAPGTRVHLPQQQDWSVTVPVDVPERRESAPRWSTVAKSMGISDLAMEYLQEAGILGKTPFDSDRSHHRRVCRVPSSLYDSDRRSSSWYTLGCRDPESISRSYSRACGLSGGPYADCSRSIRCSADVLDVFSQE